MLFFINNNSYCYQYINTNLYRIMDNMLVQMIVRFFMKKTLHPRTHDDPYIQLAFSIYRR